jgi:putative SOS response-associated peptidase YedK
MCAHYESVHQQTLLKQYLGVELPSALARRDVWPGLTSTFIRRHPHADGGDNAVPDREALAGTFGLIPHWAKDNKIARHTYNARSETVADKPSFRDACRQARHCIIPVQSFFEPDWRSGKAVPTAIRRLDGSPLGVAGLWSEWRSPQGQNIHTFTLLTINADAHPLMQHFHKPQDEKRMILILPPTSYDDWLRAKAQDRAGFLNAYPAELSTTTMGEVHPTQQSGSLW